MADENPQRPRIHAEMLVGISAVVIGVCALGVSLYETSLMREEQRAAVMPLLELSRSYFLATDEASGKEPRLWLQAQNVGIGPARVADFRVTIDGVPYPTWNAALRELIRHDSSISYGQSTINGRTIPPDRLVTMMELNDNELAEKILLEFDRLNFEACFCSIFDECWTTSYRDFGAATRVESCQRSDSSFIE
ncbi:MAG: hypothetical protein GWP62_02785 [Gammaproteobacteria bacterium]|nr:hypothetical protein [Gammaproteobacteria bacterium]